MSDTTRTGRARPATLAKRERILEAAVEIFGSKGSINGTLADVAEQVGMTHAGVLHHFGSKHNLLLEVLRYRDQSDVAGLESRIMPDGPELFLHLVRTAVMNADRPGIVQAFTVLSAESVTEGHAAHEFFSERYVFLRTAVEGAFRDLCAQQNIADTAVISQASASILAAMDGLQLQWLLSPESFELGEATEFAIRAIVNGVIHPGPALEDYVPRPG